MANKNIYLDYASTTPLDKNVLKEMLPYLEDKFGNPMSLHSFGREALEAVDKARETTAKFFNVSTIEIIFTSGATEANNLAIKGIVKSYWSRKNKLPHIITSQFEHHCVLNTCQSLEKEKLAEVSYIKIGKDGIINIEDILQEIKENTILVSIMYVNNEVGTVQPVLEIGDRLKKINSKRRESEKIYFHTDATQAVNYFGCDIKKLGADLLSMSAHKIYGPKGTGCLVVQKGTLVSAIQNGGDQENKMRAGTHNVSGIVGLGKSLEILEKEKWNNIKKITKLRDYLTRRVLKEIPDSVLNGSAKKRSPNNANFSFKDIEGESLLISLDMEGIACSTGSACSSGALSPSHVLLALGLKPEQAHSSLRVTLGKYSTKKEIDTAVNKMKKIIYRLRKISGNVLGDYYDNNKK